MTNTLFKQTLNNQSDTTLTINKGDLIIITGETATGKSTTSLQLASSALKNQHDVLYINDEDIPHAVAKKLADITGISDLHKSLKDASFRHSTNLDYINIGFNSEEYKHKETNIVIIIDVVDKLTSEDVGVLNNLANNTGATFVITTQINRSSPNTVLDEDFDPKEEGVKVIKTSKLNGELHQEVLLA